MLSDHYLEYWSLNPLYTWCMHQLCKSSGMKRYLAKLTIFSPLVAKKWQHTDWCSFQEWFNFLATLAKFQSSGGQRWPKLVVYDKWPVSWHFLAMCTVGLCWLSDDIAIRSLDLLVCTKESSKDWWIRVVRMQPMLYSLVVWHICALVYFCWNTPFVNT